MTAIRIRSPLIERFDIAWITEELIGISAFEEIPGFVFSTLQVSRLFGCWLFTHWLFGHV